MSGIGRTVGLCVAFIVLVVGMFVFSTVQTPQLSEEDLRERGVFLLPRPRELAPFALQDHTGATFSNEALVGHWTFLFFGFTTCPDICPTAMSELGQAERALHGAGIDTLPEAAAFQGVLVTVDPERDTTEVLGPYATAFSDRFLGVRGALRDTGLFAQDLNVAFGKVPTEDGSYTMDHSGNIVLINPRGHYHGFIKLPHSAETIRLTYESLAARF